MVPQPPTPPVRILVLGDQGVGKTHLTHLLCHSSPHPLKNSWTIGCSLDLKLFSYQGITYVLEFVDIGILKHRASRNLFYKDVDAVILVHDSSNRKSFMHLSRWVSELNEAIGLWAALNGVNIDTGHQSSKHSTESTPLLPRPAADPQSSCPTLPILVVGTKSDLLPMPDSRPSSPLKSNTPMHSSFDVFSSPQFPESISLSTTSLSSYYLVKDTFDEFFSKVIHTKYIDSDVLGMGSSKPKFPARFPTNISRSTSSSISQSIHNISSSFSNMRRTGSWSQQVNHAQTQESQSRKQSHESNSLPVSFLKLDQYE